MTNWNEIEGTVTRATSGIIYSIWGGVGFSISYDRILKSIKLIVWDKSYKDKNKKEVVNHNFEIDLEKIWYLKAQHDCIGKIEEYLLENYS